MSPLIYGTILETGESGIFTILKQDPKGCSYAIGTIMFQNTPIEVKIYFAKGNYYLYPNIG
jgi:hypothetical protein